MYPSNIKILFNDMKRFTINSLIGWKSKPSLDNKLIIYNQTSVCRNGLVGSVLNFWRQGSVFHFHPRLLQEYLEVRWQVSWTNSNKRRMTYHFIPNVTFIHLCFGLNFGFLPTDWTIMALEINIVLVFKWRKTGH